MYRNIIFPIDLNEKNSWKSSFPVVVELAKSCNAKLNIMTVVPDYGLSMVQQYFPKGWVKEIMLKTTEELKAIIAKNVPSDIEVNAIVDRGAIYQCILNKSKEIEADLIIIPAHRPELPDYLLGQNAAKVVRHASISVLVLRNDTNI